VVVDINLFERGKSLICLFELILNAYLDACDFVDGQEELVLHIWLYNPLPPLPMSSNSCWNDDSQSVTKRRKLLSLVERHITTKAACDIL